MTTAQHQAAAFARFLRSDSNASLNKIVADLEALSERIGALAESRTFRREVIEAFGPGMGKGIIQDCSAAAWSLTNLGGIIGSITLSIARPETTNGA